MRKAIVTSLALMLSMSVDVQAQGKSTLEIIKQRGTLSCGVSQGLYGFSAPDDKGRWMGLDADFCRAVAAAVVGDKEKVVFKSLSSKDRFTALQSSEIDLLSRTTTWTMTRDSALGLSFIGTMYYDGQSFLLRKSLGIKSARELKGASICTLAGSTSELNLADFFRRNQLDYKPVVFEKTDEVVAAYDAGRCDAYSTDATQLQAERIRLKSPDDHVVLPELISKEPLAPVVRQGEARKVAGALQLILIGASLGGVESLVEHRASVEGPDSVVPKNMLRFSIGIESIDDLIADLEQALATLG